MDIKICKKDDLKEFLPLIDVEEAGDGLVEEIEENSDETYVLELDNKVIGIAYFEDDDDPYISIYIFKDHRRKGYGTAALKQIEQKCIASGAKLITAIYAYHNDVAKQFLLKNGYELTWASTEMKYDGERFEEPDLPIRQYRDEDFDEAFKLSAEAFHRMRVGTGCFPNSVVAIPREDTREKWARHMEEKYVIDAGGEIIGYANLDEDEISSVSIKISHQNKGLGKQFVKCMTNRLIDRGVDEPVLWCVVGNKNARHIYDSLGYKEVFCEGFAEKKL